MRAAAVCGIVTLGLAVAGGAVAQGVEVPAAAPDATARAADPATLAAMRTDLAALGRALQSLRAELVASGPAGFTAAGGTAAIDRMDRMEAQIAALTGQVEQSRKRVDAAIAEATNRAGDIEFRLCEVDPDCDLGALTTAQIDGAGVSAAVLPGGAAGPAGGTVTGSVSGTGPVPDSAASQSAPTQTAPAPTTPVQTAPAQNAPAAEAAALDRASAALAAGKPAEAARLLDAFVADHPASTLLASALMLRGRALLSGGDPRAAARAWTEALLAAPQGPQAPAAILALGNLTAADGKADAACAFYADLVTRFPGAPEADEATRRAAACAPGDARQAQDAAAGLTVPDAVAVPGGLGTVSGQAVPTVPGAPVSPTTAIPTPQMDPEEAADLADEG